MATVAELIREVRDHPGGDPFAGLSDATILRFLNRYIPQLSLEVGKYRPDLQQVTEQVALASYDFDTGHTIVAAFDVPVGGDVVFENADLKPDPLSLVPYAERNALRWRWGAYLDAGVLFLLGYESHWDDVLRVDVHLQKTVTALTGRTDSPDLPGDPTDVLVAKTVAWRVPEYTPVAIEAERQYLNRVTGRDRAAVYRPRLT